ncbi:adenylate kinase [Synechococcus sp. BSF8S]|uniref:adenylate kinase n=1 Tax=Synechococcales TaxID=1890424 RepID=UPI00162A035E|nr:MULTISPECIES: adenylate kinase [unclassified Synechococcus]MBC1259795.1 adenylate kinase [Synechococcus sp. BSF8S]MBC1262782.1 adenylate kinase [Synechococcus sp. BSA11S]
MSDRLLFLGPPGAGKGTQAQQLAEGRQLLHLSTGDLLRAEVQAGTELGAEAQAVMSRGELVSDALVLAIVRARLLGHDGGWLLDGFPRNLAQAEALGELLDELQKPIQHVILLQLDDGILLQRLLSRGREDDNEAVIRHRLEVYREQTAPLIAFYRNLGLIREVEAEGSVEAVASRISSILG